MIKSPALKKRPPLGSRLVGSCIIGIGVLIAAAPASAVDGVSIAGGGGDDASMARVGLLWDWNQRWFQNESWNWHINGYWELSAAYWHANSAPGSHDIGEVGFTPVFRFEQNDQRGLYGELGVGAHFLSRTSINRDTKFSTSFQFGDQIGFGYRFGATGAHDIGYTYQHLSNASIKRPNDGINFHILRYQYRF